MADMEVQVIARAVGFDVLAAQAERASVAFKNLMTATQGANGAGAAATKRLADDMARINGVKIGSTLGTQIRTGMTSAISNQGFWSSAFSGLSSRFQTFGRTLGRSLALGVQGAVGQIKGMNGGNGPSHSDLFGTALLGGLAFKGVEDLVKTAAQRQGALFRLAATGLTTAPQRTALVDLAEDWSNKFGNISTTEGIDFLKDSLQIFGGTHELFADEGKSNAMTPEGRAAMTRIAGLLSYSKAYQAASGHEGNPEAVMAQFASAIRSGEIKGLGSNPTDLANWVEKLTKIQLATGVDPTTFLQAQRAAGLSFLTMNDDAILKFATMVQENKSRAGVMAATAFMHMVGGGSQTVRSNEAMRSLGFFGDDANVQALEKAGKLELNKNGQIKHINDTSIIPNDNDFAKDQYKWYADTLYPAVRKKLMQKTGIDIGDTSKPPSQRTLDDIANVMRELGATFKNRNEANQAAESIIQAPQIERRAELARKAAIDEQAANDLIVKQTMDFAAQMNNLKVNLGQTILPSVTDLLKTFTGWVKGFGDFSKAHPELSGNILKYGLGGMIGGGLLASVGILLSFMKLPFAILKGLGSFGVRTLFGAGLGVSELIGGAAAAGKLGATMASVNRWIANSGTIGKILGSVGRLMSVLGTIFTAYAVGKWAVNTKTGQLILDSAGKGLDATLNPGTSQGKRVLATRAYWQNDRKLRELYPWLARLTTPVPEPTYLNTLLGDRAKYLDFAHHQGAYRGWLQHVRQPEQSWVPSFSGFAPRGGGPNMGNAKSGPVPVVVQSMPKGADKPNVVNVGGVTVNVQTNASPQAIGGAVGSAVGSKVSNALSDQHH